MNEKKIIVVGAGIDKSALFEQIAEAKKDKLPILITHEEVTDDTLERISKDLIKHKLSKSIEKEEVHTLTNPRRTEYHKNSNQDKRCLQGLHIYDGDTHVCINCNTPKPYLRQKD